MSRTPTNRRKMEQQRISNDHSSGHSLGSHPAPFLLIPFEAVRRALATNFSETHQGCKLNHRLTKIE